MLQQMPHMTGEDFTSVKTLWPSDPCPAGPEHNGSDPEPGEPLQHETLHQILLSDTELGQNTTGKSIVRWSVLRCILLSLHVFFQTIVKKTSKIHIWVLILLHFVWCINMFSVAEKVTGEEFDVPLKVLICVKVCDESDPESAGGFIETFTLKTFISHFWCQISDSTAGMISTQKGNLKSSVRNSSFNRSSCWRRLSLQVYSQSKSTLSYNELREAAVFWSS